MYIDLFDHKGIYVYFFNALGKYLDLIFLNEVGLFVVEIFLIIFSGVFLEKKHLCF